MASGNNTGRVQRCGWFSESGSSVMRYALEGGGAAMVVNGRGREVMTISNGDDDMESSRGGGNLAGLYEIVIKMVTKSYGIEEHYESFQDSAIYLLKFLKCVSKQRSEKMLGIYEHTDKNFMTFLDQHEVSGLEILAKDGKWFEVEYPPSSFVVLAGDALMAWTNGIIEAPTHRVMMTGNKDRFSMTIAIFIKDHEIEIPQELVDDNHPLQFRAFDNFKYIRYAIDNADIIKSSSEWSIKSY